MPRTRLGTRCKHLWEATNILRGQVDAADFKTNTCPLLFFKGVSDVYNEEMQQALEESGSERQLQAGRRVLRAFTFGGIPC